MKKEIYNLTIEEAEEELSEMFNKYYKYPSKNIIECHLISLLIGQLEEIRNALMMLRSSE